MIAERLAGQLLAGPPALRVTDVATRLLAVQAQDPRGVRLAIRARSTGLSALDVDRALTTDRSVVIGWLNRGTLHLVRSEDYWWLHALTTPPLVTALARRLAQEGVAPDAAERAVRLIERALSEEGPLTRNQLRDRIAAASARTQGQALIQLLALACNQRIALRGPVAGGEHAYVLARDWLGEAQPVSRELALAELARRYLAGHGPAGDRDLAKWAGLPLRDARAGLDAISGELDQRVDGLVALVRRASVPAMAPPRLLGAFEPLLLGWRSREPIVGGHEHALVGGGVFRPFALVGGRAAASWGLAGGRVEIAPFSRLSAADRAALASDAQDVVRYLGVR